MRMKAGKLLNVASMLTAQKKPMDPTQIIQLSKMAHGINTTMVLYAALRFGIPDLLEHGPKTVVELAEATGTVPNRLSRLLRAMITLGILSETRTWTSTTYQDG